MVHCPSVWTTTYEYDLNDQLTRITDSQNNVKTMTYDGLKRKTFMNDPDRGVMNYVYDEASNLSKTTDAKNQRISYTYDGANRILTEDYHDEGLPFSAEKRYLPSNPISPSNRADVVYFYDAPESNLPQGDNTTATARNVRGALAYVWDLSGEEHNGYDARGRIEYTVKRIPDPVFWTNRAMAISPLWLVSYRTGFDYDSLDRNIKLTYPDLDYVTYEYNSRNLLQRIPGGPNTNVISAIAYTPSGQQQQIDYGNGVRTTYDYDARLRLSRLHTYRLRDAGTTGELIDFGYDFDKVSNINAIHDNRPGVAVPEGDKRRNTQIFSYDDLYRLTHVHYSFNLPGQPTRNDGQIDYRYDRIGNMLAQTSTIVHNDDRTGLPIANLGTMDSGGTLGRWGRTGRAATDPPGPHALTSITPSTSSAANGVLSLSAGGEGRGEVVVAQTRVSQPSTLNSQTRKYPYDGNGNMMDIDGLQCNWDFKDRLIAAENDEMHADYTYDFTDRRISKSVKKKASN